MTLNSHRGGSTGSGTSAEPWGFVFAMEQALGHVVHTANIERVLRGEHDISPIVIRIDRGSKRGSVRNWALANWSVEASLATRRELRAQLSVGRPDAIFIHTQVASLLSRRIMRCVPTVVSLDATPLNFDTMADAYRHRTGNNAVEGAKTWINRRALRAASEVVTWSRWARASVVGDYDVPPDRVHVIPPGVDLHRFRPRDGARDAGPLRLLFVGGDFERKGGRDVVEAVSHLGPSVELDVVSGSAADVMGAPGVRVHGAVAPNSDELHGLYRKADVFVLPSRGDCSPLAVAEALASGLPVIASNVGGLPELVVDGLNGVVVPIGKPRELAEAIRHLAAEPSLRAAMGERSRSLAVAEHDVETNCRAILDLMRRLACSSRAGHPMGNADDEFAPTVDRTDG